jgi:hypothetical protein
VDLDLVVVSPMGRIFRGNDRTGNTEEHFSTTERVIISVADLETGTYKIHVICASHDIAGASNFVVVAVGEIEKIVGGFLIFTQDKTCIGCGEGTCDANTGICNCAAKGKIGQTCQNDIIVFSEEGVRTQVLESLDIVYFSIVKAEGLICNLSIEVELVGGYEYWQFLTSSGRRPEGPVFTYDQNCSTPCVVEFENLGSPRFEIGTMLRSNSPKQETFCISLDLDLIKVPDSGPEKKGLSTEVLIIIGAVGGVVVIAVLVTIVWVMLRRRTPARFDPKYENLLQSQVDE